jgi:hypothetical protein
MLSHQSLHTLPAGRQHSHFSPVSTLGPARSQAMAYTNPHCTSAGFLQSGSPRPIAQYSPYSEPASVISSQHNTSSAQKHHIIQHSSIHMHESWSFAGLTETDGIMIPVAPSSQGGIQLMTIKSQQGHKVQIPVDDQAASKVADEKRRRNAGASTRFRARRKERERETSMSISKLEQQLQNAIEDAKFYREERDRYRGLYLRQHSDIPGKLSPRLRRLLLSPSVSAPPTRGKSENSSADYEEGANEDAHHLQWYKRNCHLVSNPLLIAKGGSSQGSQSLILAPIDLTMPQQVHHSQLFLHHEQAQQPMASKRPVYYNPSASSPGRGTRYLDPQ